MSQGQRTVLFQFVTTLIVLAIFTPRFLSKLAAGDFAGPDGLAATGGFFLIAIVVAIVLAVAVHIVGAILIAIVTGSGEVDDLTDERDRAFDLVGERISHWLSGIGFLIGLIVLWRGGAGAYLPALTYLGFALGDIAGNGYKLARYVRG